jgi:hypothetical protein
MERRDAVKRGFVYAWQKYKDYAWGESHFQPPNIPGSTIGIVPMLTPRS